MTPLILPSVNFYILPDSDPQNRLFFVFRLVEKAFEKQLSTLIVTADNEQLSGVDRLIWTAKPARFLAHEVLKSPRAESSSIIWLTDSADMAHTVEPAPQVVVDLSYDAEPMNHPKIMLIANQHPEVLPNARMKYQAYVNQGVQPTVHKVSEKWLSLWFWGIKWWVV